MKKASVWLAVGAAIPIFVIVAWMMLDSACGELNDLALLNACRYGWIGALSGWAAAIGALLAAIWAVQGVRRQIRQQYLQDMCQKIRENIKTQSTYRGHVRDAFDAVQNLVVFLKNKELTEDLSNSKEELFDVLNFAEKNLRSAAEGSTREASLHIETVLSLIGVTKETEYHRNIVSVFVNSVDIPLKGLEREVTALDRLISEQTAVLAPLFAEYSTNSGEF